MNPPTLCMICEAIGGQASIGKIAREQVETALAAGWRVTAVANVLDETLRARVEWLKLHVPRRVFAFQWLTGRHWIKKALGSRTFDVVHGHQPQIADLCDVYQCHFLTRSAYRHHCLFGRPGAGTRLADLQKRIVLLAEDRFYRRWNAGTRMVFVSAMLREEFGRYYGLPPRETVLENAVPAFAPATDEQRRAARAHYFGQADGRTVVGYLGGMDERKGITPLLDAMTREDGVHLLLGGNGTERMPAARPDRVYPVGTVHDLDRFYAACDLVIVPSIFDPCPVVVVEAVSRRVPVIVTAGVGNKDTVVSCGAGLCWDTAQPLGPTVRRIIDDRASFEQGTENFARMHSSARYRETMENLWRDALT